MTPESAECGVRNVRSGLTNESASCILIRATTREAQRSDARRRRRLPPIPSEPTHPEPTRSLVAQGEQLGAAHAGEEDRIKDLSGGVMEGVRSSMSQKYVAYISLFEEDREKDVRGGVHGMEVCMGA